MEQKIKDRYTPEILQQAMTFYDIQQNQIKILDSFESYIYEFSNDLGEFILRISHSIRRDKNLIQAEVDWINYLAARGVGVAKAILSSEGNLVEAIPDHQGGYFLTTAFVKAQGSDPWGRWSPFLYEIYGEEIGKMHHFSQKYRPSSPEFKRPAWDDPIFNFVEPFLPKTEKLILEKYQQICVHVNRIPKTNETYGLIHQDAHGGNLFIDQNNHFTFFDFDDCGYSWFINDISIVLFYIIAVADDKNKLTQEFLPHFLRGYLRHCDLNLDLLDEIPHFLKIREIELYSVIQRDFDLDQIDDNWIKRFMKDRKSNIVDDVPFIDYDFNALKYMV